MLKFLKFNEVREEQCENMDPIFFTSLESKPLMSKLIIFVHSANIKEKSTTSLVSKFFISIKDSFWHPLNILDIFLTFFV